jgi:hypothetical protein
MEQESMEQLFLQNKAVDSIQTLLASVARKIHEHASKTRKLLREQEEIETENARIGLSCL